MQCFMLFKCDLVRHTVVIPMHKIVNSENGTASLSFKKAKKTIQNCAKQTFEIKIIKI